MQHHIMHRARLLSFCLWQSSFQGTNYIHKVRCSTTALWFHRVRLPQTKFFSRHNKLDTFATILRCWHHSPQGEVSVMLLWTELSIRHLAMWCSPALLNEILTEVSDTPGHLHGWQSCLGDTIYCHVPNQHGTVYVCQIILNRAFGDTPSHVV